MTRVTYLTSKTGKNWTVTREDTGEVVQTLASKAKALAWVEAQFSTTTQEQPVTEDTTAQDNANEAEQEAEAAAGDAYAASQETAQEAPATAEAKPELTDEEKAQKAKDRSDKLRAAMLAAHAAPFDATTNPHHGANKSFLKLRLIGDEGDEPTIRPARPYFKRMSDFSDKSAVENVTLDGQEVEARRTRGTWKNVTTTFLWFEAPILSFPPSMHTKQKAERDTLTYHVMVENDQWDNLDGAEFFTIDDSEVEAAKAAAVRPPIESAVPVEPAPKPAKAPKADAPAKVDGVAPAKRLTKAQREAAKAEAEAAAQA